MKASIRNYLERIIASLRDHGLSTTLFKLRVLIEDHLFDYKFGIDTCGISDLNELTIRGENKKRGYEYKPTRVILLRRLFDAIRPLIPAQGVLVDFGCGKGRVLLVGSEFGFREGRGVEFARELCKIARRNCAAYKARTGVKTEFRIIESDVVDYRVRGDDNVFFMFNPFDETILSRVIGNIIASLRKELRKILVIYHNPRFNHVIEQRSGFARVEELNFWGNRFNVYSNER